MPTFKEISDSLAKQRGRVAVLSMVIDELNEKFLDGHTKAAKVLLDDDGQQVKTTTIEEVVAELAKMQKDSEASIQGILSSTVQIKTGA